MRADEKLSAFLELESAIRVAVNWFGKLTRFLPNSESLNGFASGGGRFSRQRLAGFAKGFISDKAERLAPNEFLNKEAYMKTSPYLLVLATFALVGCAGEPTTVTTTTTREVTTTGPPTREVLVTQAPPAVRVETQPVSPGPGYIWTTGYWRWTGAQYVWVPGTWIVRQTPAAVWVEGHWVRRPGENKAHIAHS